MFLVLVQLGKDSAEELSESSKYYSLMRQTTKQRLEQQGKW
jgi:hypothetical protein